MISNVLSEVVRRTKELVELEQRFLNGDTSEFKNFRLLKKLEARGFSREEIINRIKLCLREVMRSGKLGGVDVFTIKFVRFAEALSKALSMNIKSIPLRKSYLIQFALYELMKELNCEIVLVRKSPSRKAMVIYILKEVPQNLETLVDQGYEPLLINLQKVCMS